MMKMQKFNISALVWSALMFVNSISLVAGHGGGSHAGGGHPTGFHGGGGHPAGGGGMAHTSGGHVGGAYAGNRGTWNHGGQRNWNNHGYGWNNGNWHGGYYGRWRPGYGYGYRPGFNRYWYNNRWWWGPSFAIALGGLGLGYVSPISCDECIRVYGCPGSAYCPPECSGCRW